MRTLSIIPVALALTTTALAGTPPPKPLPPIGVVSPLTLPPPPPAPTPAPADSSAAAAFATSSNAFAVDLYRRLSASSDNVVFSPASIEMALEMTWAGARGDTAAQMHRVLHLGDDRDALAAAKAITARYAARRDGYDLVFANRLFGESSSAFDPDFLSVTRETFHAPLQPLAFAHEPDAGRAAINVFVDGTTRGKIHDLLPPGSIQESTKLVLVNAVYLNAKWSHPFTKEGTAPQSFATPNGAVQIPMMHEQASLGYGEVDGARVLDMPYLGGDLALTVVLPDNGGLAALERTLGPSSIQRFVGATAPTLVDVALPKFKIDPTAPVRLKTVLSSLGMPLAFSDRADFSRMTRGDEPIKIDDAYHKAFVAVDEAGTEAAAATAVVARAAGVTSVQPKGVPFVADHPFLFAIRDARTNLVLFMGRVTRPQG